MCCRCAGLLQKIGSRHFVSQITVKSSQRRCNLTCVILSEGSSKTPMLFITEFIISYGGNIRD